MSELSKWQIKNKKRARKIDTKSSQNNSFASVLNLNLATALKYRLLSVLLILLSLFALIANAQIVVDKGNVGIGTTGPGAKLHVSGDVAVSNFGSAGAYRAYRADATTLKPLLFVQNDAALADATRLRSAGSGITFQSDAGSNLMTILDGGNVGIGTTGPTEKLDVNGSIKFTGTSHRILPGGVGGFGVDSNALAGDQLRVGEIFGGIGLYSGDGITAYDLGLVAAVGRGVGISGGAVSPFVGNGLFVSSANNVGIGTATPSAKLHVGGTSGVDGIKFPDGTLQTTAFTGGGGGGWTDGGTNVYITTSTDNVGIGTTAPTAKLHIKSPDSSWNSGIRLEDDATTNHFTIIYDDRLRIAYNDGAAYGIVVDTAGNVGIGTAGPVSKLHIHGNYINDGSGGFTLDATDTADPERYVLRINPYVVGAGMVGYQFQTKSAIGGTNVPLTFNNAGNVGIGTAAPGAKLDVSGAVRMGNNVWHTSSDARKRLYFATDSRTYFGSQDGYTWRSAADTDLVTLTNAGNFGIGTANPTTKLEVVGNVQATQFCLDSSCISAWPSGSGSSQWTTNGANIYYNTGNVGIGTTSPAAKLHVTSNIRTTNGAGAPWDYIDLFAGGTVSTIAAGDTNLHIKAQDNNIYFTDWFNGPALKLGIGTTSPTSTLHVIGKGTFTGGVDPPYISFSDESHKSIRQYAKDVEQHEKVMMFWNANSKRMETYVIDEDRFYTLDGNIAEQQSN